MLRLTRFVAVDGDLPAQQQAELRAFVDGSRLWESYSAVFRVTDQTMGQVRRARTLGNRPLVVLTATEHGLALEGERLHQSLQAELATLSSTRSHQIVDGATHVSLVHNRQQSQATIAAIQQVIEAARDAGD